MAKTTLSNSLDKAKEDKKKAFNEELKRIKKGKEEVSETLQQDMKKKESALDFYNKLNDYDKEQFQKEIKKKKIRNSYIEYLKYVYPDYKLTKFHVFLANICESVVRKIEKGEDVKILLSVPPRHGKSKTVTKTLPSWFLGRNPNRGVILTGYNADIAEEFGDSNRQLVKTFGKDIFGIETSDSQDNKTLWEIKGYHDSGVLSAGIQGGITGHGGSLIIVDDPYKSGIDCDNPTTRNIVSSTFKDSIYTRWQGIGKAIIVIHTRWREDDLIGELEKKDGWIVINIPCEYDGTDGVDRYFHRKVGETLCPELGYDAKWAMEMKATIGAKKWAALYQGKPYVEGGMIVKSSDIKYYNKETIPCSFEELTLSCDLSFGGKKDNNDPCCMTLWGRNGGNHYLLQVINKKLSFVETLERLRYISGRYPQLKKKLIEKKANGGATIEILNNEIGGFVPFDPKGASKQERLETVMPFFEAGNVWFPDESVDKDIQEYVQQLLRFPNVVHDDFVDTISQYLLNYQYRYGGKISTDGRYAKFAKAIRGI